MENNLQNKLYQFETPPPTGTWERIEENLNNTENYAQRLVVFAEQPPAVAWHKIEAALNEAATPAKIVPFSIRYQRPLRYAAAASLIAALLVTATLILRRTETGSLAGINQSRVPAKQIKQENNVTTKVNEGALPKQANINTEAKTVLASVKRTLAYIAPQKILPRLSFSKRFMPRKVAEESVANFTAQEAFMVYSDGNGNAMRLPKKLFSLVNCNDGDETCKQRIEVLRQKLSASVSPSDFTGMLDLVRELQ